MGPLKPPTLLESVAGSTGTQIALTAAGAAAAGPLAALLPVLATSLAYKRHNERVAAAFERLTAELSAVQEKVAGISEDQLKVVCEAVNAIYTATDAGKIEYLQRAVLNGLNMTDLRQQAAVFLARVLRGISAQEAAFVVRNFGFVWVMVTDMVGGDGKDDAGTLFVRPDSEEDGIIAGLLSLGVLVPAGATIDSIGKAKFSPFTAQLIALLRPRPVCLPPRSALGRPLRPARTPPQHARPPACPAVRKKIPGPG